MKYLFVLKNIWWSTLLYFSIKIKWNYSYFLTCSYKTLTVKKKIHLHWVIITIVIGNTCGRDNAVFTSPFSLPAGTWSLYFSVSQWDCEQSWCIVSYPGQLRVGWVLVHPPHIPPPAPPPLSSLPCLPTWNLRSLRWQRCKTEAVIQVPLGQSSQGGPCHLHQTVM